MCELEDMEKRVLHPRPSPVAAAMYTLRDLGVEVIVLHGPAGCNFRAARLLERDGVVVVTSSLDQNSVIFGGESCLIETLQEVEKRFSPSFVGVVGTCCATIIGEDMQSAVDNADVAYRTIVVDCDPYNPDNVDGAIRTLEAAKRERIVSPEEISRQISMLRAANKNEKERGSARERYFPTFDGDNIFDAASLLKDSFEKDEKVALVLNAKKETSYLYADVLCAAKELHDSICSNSPLFAVANIAEDVGLEKIRNYARIISSEFENCGIKVDVISGGLDEYAISGIRAAEAIKNESHEWGTIVVCGLPHAVPLWDCRSQTVAVSTGSRALYAIKDLGFDYVLDEGMAHYSVLGANGIVESTFGTALRMLCGD